VDYTAQVAALQDASAKVTEISSALASVSQAHQSLGQALAQAQAQLQAATAALTNPTPATDVAS